VPPTAPRPLAALEVLLRHDVEFIVVGMMAGILHGAPLTTYDLDVVHRRTADNIERLVAALVEMGAGYRDLTGRHLPPNPALLAAAPGHNLFSTRFGSVDALATVGQGEGYDELLPRSIDVNLGAIRVRALTLEHLIALKRRAGRPKDLAVLPVLERTVEEIARAAALDRSSDEEGG
jgi:hypothetical protein